MARPENNRKLDLSGSTGGLHNPFQTLPVAGLPPGPEMIEPVAEPETKTKKGRVVLRREKAQRGGKTVVVVGDIPYFIGAAEIEELARGLRKSCGCGGTVREREIEIQGDQAARVCEFLERAGFRVAGVRS